MLDNNDKSDENAASGFDLRVETRFKNNILWRMVVDHFWEDAKREWNLKPPNRRGPLGFGHVVERETGVPRNVYYALLNLQQSPYDKRTGQPSKSAIRLINFFQTTASELFPPSLYNLKLPPVVAKEYRSVELLPLLEDSKLVYPDYDGQMDRHKMLDEALSTLTEREQRIIRWGFYEDLTLKEIGGREGTGAERIRQIEAKALRKLRHPSRSHLLRPLL